MYCFLLLSLLLNILLPCETLTPSSYWIKPPASGTSEFYNEDVIFQLNSDVTLQWTTNKTFYSIFLFQQQTETYAGLGNSIYTKEAGQDEKGGYTWRVTTQSFSLSDSPVFFFSLAPSGDLTNDATTSHYFNITVSSSIVTTTSSTTSSTSSSTTSSSTTSSTSTTSSISTVSSTSTTPPAIITSSISTTVAGNVPTAPANLSSSSVENIGLGVGLGVGIPIVLLLAALVVFVFNRGRKKNFRTTQNDYGTPIELLKQDPFPLLNSHGVSTELPNGQGVGTELPNGQGISAELPNSERKRLHMAELS